MGHLTTESLARILSEPPDPEERKHLDSCPVCRGELQALKEQTERLGALPDLRPPPGDWEALEGRLLGEGLIQSSGLSLHPGRWRTPVWLQAAAALVLFIGGTALGSRITGDGPGQGLPGPGAPSDLQLVPVGGMAQSVTTLEEAAEAVNLAERQYVDALVRYRQLVDAQGEPSLIGDPTSRFAALEGILASARAAVQQAPADPFVNGVLLGAMAEREAILRNASLTRGDEIF